MTISEVDAGNEPGQFVVHFIQWEPEFAAKWLEGDSFAKLKAVGQLSAEESKSAAVNSFDGCLDPKTNKFTYD